MHKLRQPVAASQPERATIPVIEGKRPLTRWGIDKDGICALCGVDGPLSVTHVPPEGAGNSAEVIPLITVDDGGGGRGLTAGRPRQGGTRGYFFCERCNNLAGRRYDPTLVDLWKVIGKDLLVEKKMPPAGMSCRYTIKPISVGAFVRSVLAGCIALCPSICNDFPTIRDAVFEEAQIEPPPALHLLFAFYPGPERWVNGGGITRVSVKGHEIQMTHTFAEMAWPPFYFVLTDDSGLAQWQQCDDLLSYLAFDIDTKGELELVGPRLDLEHPMAGAFAGDDAFLNSIDAPGGGRMFSTGFEKVEGQDSE
jgi:hypothetical protein